MFQCTVYCLSSFHKHSMSHIARVTISHLAALDLSTGYSCLHVSSKVRRTSLVIYSIPMLQQGRGKNAIIERGVSVKEHWFTSWIGVNYPPFQFPSSANVYLIQYLAAVVFFHAASDSLLRSEGCGWDMTECPLWVSELLGSPIRADFKSTMKYLSVKKIFN